MEQYRRKGSDRATPKSDIACTTLSGNQQKEEGVDDNEQITLTLAAMLAFELRATR